MKTPAIHNQPETSGPKAAAIIAAGLGLITLGFSDTILEFIHPLLNLLGYASDTDQNSVVQQGALGTTGWLGSWAYLHHRWKRIKQTLKKLLIFGFIILIVCLVGFSDRFVDFF